MLNDQLILPNRKLKVDRRKPDKVHEELHVMVPIFNYKRQDERWKLYDEFVKYATDCGATVWTIELAFGARDWAVTDKDNPRHIQVRTGGRGETGHQIFSKENLINYGIKHLTQVEPNWEYVAWIDADVTFANPYWVSDTIHALQDWDIVQMFDHVYYLDSHNSLIEQATGLGYCHLNPHKVPPMEFLKYYDSKNYYTTEFEVEEFEFKKVPISYWHCGIALAATRRAIKGLGGLIDWAILGSSDWLMGMCLLNIFEESKPVDGLGEHGWRWVIQWQERANKVINGNFGYVEGACFHYWHGALKNRLYKTRDKILKEENFCVELDLKKNEFGLWELTDRNPRLRNRLKGYFNIAQGELK